MQIDAECAAQAVTPTPTEKTRAAQYIEGTLEEINLDDWPDGITTIPGKTIIMQRSMKNVTIPASVKVIEGTVIDTCRVQTVTINATSALKINTEFVSQSISAGLSLKDELFDLDIPTDYTDAIVDLSALAFVPTFVPKEGETAVSVFSIAKKILVKESLVNAWKNLSTLGDSTKSKVVGV